MNRRGFLRHTLLGGAATAFGVSRAPSLDAGVRWPIGCFNRPWTTWSFDETLKQIKAAGYQTTGLLTRTKDEPFIGADATPEYLARLKQRIAGSGLKPSRNTFAAVVLALFFSPAAQAQLKATRNLARA